MARTLATFDQETTLGVRDNERFRALASDLGLSGVWVEVGRKGLCDRQVRLHHGYYFLAWSDYAILWLEAWQGPDNRIPPEVYWLQAWKMDYLASPIETVIVFRAGQEHAHREALLRTVGFHRQEVPFGLMECVATPVAWEWK